MEILQACPGSFRDFSRKCYEHYAEIDVVVKLFGFVRKCCGVGADRTGAKMLRVVNRKLRCKTTKLQNPIKNLIKPIKSYRSLLRTYITPIKTYYTQNSIPVNLILVNFFCFFGHNLESSGAFLTKIVGNSSYRPSGPP